MKTGELLSKLGGGDVVGMGMGWGGWHFCACGERREAAGWEHMAARAGGFIERGKTHGKQHSRNRTLVVHQLSA